MNQQRVEAYLNLIEKLLTCPSGEENAILNQHQDLIDEGLVIIMQALAQEMTENNDENRASFLLDMASALANYLGKSATPDYQSFLSEVLKAISESNRNPQVVYPLLQKNLDKLDLTFAQVLTEWATAKFKEVPSKTAQAIAEDIVNFGNLINQFPLGRRALNLEIGIACHQASLEVYTRDAFPYEWATTQNNLANAYCDRIKGEKADNLETAIASYKASLEVYTRDAFPYEWAMTQNNLAIAYQNRIKGEKADNIETAIACYLASLEVLTREAFPYEWATTQNNLGAAYSHRIKGEKADNIETAIACYLASLEVYTRDAFPYEWAGTQNNLGEAYRNRIKGEKADNIETAITCFKASLEVRNSDAFPYDWANTQNNLANAYLNRIKGEKADNIEHAIASYQASLEVLTREAFPQYWANTQNNLGAAYTDRIKGEKADNVETAIACHLASLEVYTHDAFPYEWARSQNNLGAAYSHRIKGEKADNIETGIACYQASLEVYTRDTFPQDWAMTQNNLANAYSHRIKGEKADNIETGIACYQASLEVYTRDAFPQDWAMTQNNLGAAYSHRIKGEKADNIETAIKGFRFALEICTPEAFPLDCLTSGRNLGDLGFKEGNWQVAIEGYQKAIEAVETSRSWATSDNSRQEILAASIRIYDNLIQAYINNNQIDKALEIVDRSRAKRLVDLMASNDLYAKGEIPPEVEKYLQEFDAKQREIDSEIQKLRHSSNENKKELAGVGSQLLARAAVEAYSDKMKELEEEKQEIWKKIRKLDPVLAGQIKVNPIEFAAMQKLIPSSNTAILCFYTTNNDTHIFVIYKDKSPQLHTPPGQGYEKLHRWIFENWLNAYLNDKTAWEEGMSDFLLELGKRLKINDLIGQYLDGIEELIIIPHVDLHQIPFAAIPLIAQGESSPKTPLIKGGRGDQYLGEKFLIRYVPSCQILEYCHNRDAIESLQYGIVENATDDLYFTPFECEEIAKIVEIPPEKRLKGSQQATIQEYRNLVKQVNGLHSSHHAQCRLDNPLESQLLLGNGSITLGELMTPGWRLPELSDVFLSCCETNLGMTKITDDILTLGTGFLCAGARSVVSSLWAVDDLATALFSIFYYEYRKPGLSRPEALRRTQKKLRTISGKELKEKYQEKLNPIMENIIEKLQNELAQVKAEIEDLKAQKKPRKEIREKAAEESKINEKIKAYQEVPQTLYQEAKPFEHLKYWSAFICQGLP
ncbi:MAG: hypothetical protein RLZZ338_4130 [Cyanobacteriota bacterium]